MPNVTQTSTPAFGIEELIHGLPQERGVTATTVDAARGSDEVLVVIDDDPTGCQTVDGVPLLTSWSPADVRWAFEQDASVVFVLANTRSLSAEAAAQINQDIVAVVLAVAQEQAKTVSFISRGDSTLRGHAWSEINAIASAAGLLNTRQPDAILFCPAYVEAGRYTVDDVHWAETGAVIAPVATTPYASDPRFAYRSSNLKEYLEEISCGEVGADDVLSLTLDDIRSGGPAAVRALIERAAGRWVVVNAVSADDLRVVALGAIDAERGGRHVLYRCGPSFVRARAGMGSQVPLTDGAAIFGESPAEPPRNGLIVVGSHVPLTSAQIAPLVADPQLASIEMPAGELVSVRASDAIARIADQVVSALGDHTVILYTSRLVEADGTLEVAQRISHGVVDIVSQVIARHRPAFIVAKGGITSHDIATHALGMRRAWVRGSLRPGLISVLTPEAGPASGVPYVIFAGNVGTESTLQEVVNTLREAN